MVNSATTNKLSIPIAIVTIGKDGAKAKFSSKKDIYIVGVS